MDLMDTSVFIYFVGIRQETKNAQQQQAAFAGLKSRVSAGHQVILPIATIFETMQHIWRIQDGGERRQCAERFEKLVLDAIGRTAPWVILKQEWGESFLRGLLDQGGPVPGLVTSLAGRVHEAGDVLLLHELRILKKRYPASQVTINIWTFDTRLGATASSM
jgi:hypothetical protein